MAFDFPFLGSAATGGGTSRAVPVSISVSSECAPGTLDPRATTE